LFASSPMLTLTMLGPALRLSEFAPGEFVDHSATSQKQICSDRFVAIRADALLASSIVLTSPKIARGR